MDFLNRDAGYSGNVNQQSFKEVIAQRPDLCVKVGGRMIPPSAEKDFYAGTIMCQYTSGANAGLWVPFDTANSSATDGSQTPKGILYGGAHVDTLGNGSEIVVIIAGYVYSDLCVSYASGVAAAGMSDAVVTALGGKRLLVKGKKEVQF